MAGLFDRMLSIWDQQSGYGAPQRTADAWSKVMQQMKNEEALRSQSPGMVQSRLETLRELPSSPIISPEVIDRQAEYERQIKDKSGEFTPQQRWMSQVDYMLKSQDPTLQTKGLEMLEKYQENTLGGDNTSGAWSTYGKAAVDAGFIPGTPAYQAYVKRLAERDKGVTVNVGKESEPISVADLDKLQMPDGSDVPFGTTPSQARHMGVKYRRVLPADSAGKKAMLDTAVSQIENLDKLIFSPDGKVNRNVIQDAFFISIDPTPGKSVSKWVLKNPVAAEVAQGLEYGMQAITRTETGAAMASEEISNTKSRFMPGPTDSDEMVKQKWEAYKYFLKNASEMIDPKVRKGNDARALASEVKRVADASLKKFTSNKTPAKTPIKSGIPALPPGYKME